MVVADSVDAEIVADMEIAGTVDMAVATGVVHATGIGTSEWGRPPGLQPTARSAIARTTMTIARDLQAKLPDVAVRRRPGVLPH